MINLNNAVNMILHVVIALKWKICICQIKGIFFFIFYSLEIINLNDISYWASKYTKNNVFENSYVMFVFTCVLLLVSDILPVVWSALLSSMIQIGPMSSMMNRSVAKDILKMTLNITQTDTLREHQWLYEIWKLCSTVVSTDSQ